MASLIQAIRGMNDVLPSETPLWRSVERILLETLTQYGYEEIRFPLVESTQLFKRTIGEATDIVEKEMYTFTDLNGDSLTLRPEGTAGCVRACLEHGLLYNQQQKIWYMGPMYRHEKPQKGRYRQFNQFGIEVYGIAGVAIELELVSLFRRVLQRLGLADSVHLQLNTLGNLSERKAYREKLVSFLQAHREALDSDSLKRLDRNPLRILDTKNEATQNLLKQAPRMIDSLGDESKTLFEDLCKGLDHLNINYTINPNLVRGLDYYGHTVFEWVSDQLGSQATVCGGGRYNILVEQLGGNPTPAVGLAMGLERLLLLVQLNNPSLLESSPFTLYFIASNEAALLRALALSEKWRDLNPHWCILMNTSGGSFKSQFKKADKSGANYAIIIGDDELINNTLSLKNLRSHEDQQTLSEDDLLTYMKNRR